LTPLSDVIYYNSVDLFPSQSVGKMQLDKMIQGNKDEQLFKNNALLFSKLFKIFAPNVTIVDRTNNLVTPVSVKTLKFLEMPKTIVATQSYGEIAITRAKRLYQLANVRKKNIALMYSGGIDSTAMIVAFLHAVPEKELHKITILLNEYSIAENPNFYWNYIRGKFRIETAQLFTNYLGNDNFFFVSAEGNDQLFGSAVTQKFVLENGEDIMHLPYDEHTIVRLFSQIISKEEISRKLFWRLEKVVRYAPFKVDTIYEWFWWLNLTLKYQCVYTRLAAYTSPKYQSTLSFENNYTAFFTTPEFQCWSINNRKSLIGDKWSSYKYKSKDFIFEYTKDLEYREYKVKQGSLTKVIIQKPSCKMITVEPTGKLVFHESLPEFGKFYNRENDFV